MLELINEFSKVGGWKVNTEKSVAFLYTNSEQPKRNLRKQVHLQKHQKIKCLAISLTREVKDMHAGTTDHC